MKVCFLDYDGVVNIPMWDDTGKRCNYGQPFYGKVNSFQACQWLSEFCQKFDYKIVVTSTWRFGKNYKECLVNGGLREGVEILGRTCEIRTDDYWHDRGREVEKYIAEHPEITHYLIVDDENSFLDYQQQHFIKTRGDVGFMEKDYEKACKLEQTEKTKVGER